MKKTISLCLGCFILAACQPTLVAEFEDRAVVEGYAWQGNAPTVKISKLIALRDDISFSEENVDALALTVRDETAGTEYVLLPQGGGEYSSAVFLPAEGHTYTLSFPYNGGEVTATTTIPAKPTGMTLSATTVSVMQRPSMSSAVVSRADSREPVDVTWDNPDGAYYMIVVRCTEVNPVSIYDFDDDEDRPNFAFRTEPTVSSSGRLSMQDFSYYGRHDVILVRMQPEYALLYQSTGNTIAEIHANVEGGYGIFTGINSDTLRISVVASSGF